MLSLLALVGLPYLRAKAESAYLALSGGDAARLGLLDDADINAANQQAREMQRDAVDRALPAFGTRLCPQPELSSRRSRLGANTSRSARLERLLVATFPYMHWATEMSSFAMGCVLGTDTSRQPLLCMIVSS